LPVLEFNPSDTGSGRSPSGTFDIPFKHFQRGTITEFLECGRPELELQMKNGSGVLKQRVLRQSELQWFRDVRGLLGNPSEVTFSRRLADLHPVGASQNLDDIIEASFLAKRQPEVHQQNVGRELLLWTASEKLNYVMCDFS
jgi:hypothetical protein